MIRTTTALTLAALSGLCLAAPPAIAETVLNGGFGHNGHGTALQGGVVRDSRGALYGTAKLGGLYQYGTVFELSPRTSGTWPATTLHDFGAFVKDGRNPHGGLVLDQAGALYGVTSSGGSFCPTGGTAYDCGTVYRLTPPATPGGAWTETVLYNFAQPGGVGVGPVGGVVRDPATGVLYGATYFGGTAGYGTIYSLTPPATPGGAWTHTVLYSFSGHADGAYPSNYGSSTLTLDGSGGLYGTTVQGGENAAADAGVLFHLTPPGAGGTAWTETVLLSFGDKSVGTNPTSAVIVDGSGTLYGTAAAGGTGGRGTVYKLSPPSTPGGGWTPTLLHSFSAGTNGATPYGGLVFDGSGGLVGTTTYGGLDCADSPDHLGCGLVFHLYPPATVGGVWTIGYHHRFGAQFDGALPMTTLIASPQGAFFGSTSSGGQGSTVFRIWP